MAKASIWVMASVEVGKAFFATTARFGCLHSMEPILLGMLIEKLVAVLYDCSLRRQPLDLVDCTQI